MRRQCRFYGIENAPGTRDGLCGLVCIDADFSSMIADAAQAHTQTEIAPSLGRPSFGLYEIAVNGGVDGSVFRGRSARTLASRDESFCFGIAIQRILRGFVGCDVHRLRIDRSFQ